MGKIKILPIILLLLSFISIEAQTMEISGKVIADDEIEGIHVINKTANKFTITYIDGTFTIPVKLNDTLFFSAVNYKPKYVVIDRSSIKSKTLTVYLEEQLNLLDEVIVGKILTGDLGSDINNSGTKRDINFYDLGIPGYTGKPMTQNERRLKEASGMEMTLGGSTGGGGVGMSLNPILNAITGRTKMLKKQVKLEKLDDCLDSVKSDFSELLFESETLDEELKTEFFYYCSEDEAFETLCKINNTMRTFEFLKDKLKSYKANLQVKKE